MGEVRTSGITIQGITFHEGFRPAGLKSVDVWVIARSTNDENTFVRGRDEIIEITGSTGKNYSIFAHLRNHGTNRYLTTPHHQESDPENRLGGLLEG